MKKILILIITFCFFMVAFSNDEVENKVFIHPTAKDLSREEIAIIYLPMNIDVIMIDELEVKANYNEIHIAQGKYSFKAAEKYDIQESLFKIMPPKLPDVYHYIDIGFYPKEVKARKSYEIKDGGPLPCIRDVTLCSGVYPRFKISEKED